MLDSSRPSFSVGATRLFYSSSCLRSFLGELNDGLEPLDAEVQWVMMEADGHADGTVTFVPHLSASSHPLQRLLRKHVA